MPRARLGFSRQHAWCALAPLIALAAACGDDDGAGTAPEGGLASLLDGGAQAGSGGFYPTVTPTDPCGVSGYFFDGESDCDEIRCPELSCECESPTTASQPIPERTEVTLHACVRGVGCLSLLDCNRVCDESLALTRSACDQRIQSAGAQRCESDDDCVLGTCREESVGSICVDTMGCAEDGHCGEGQACVFDPSSLDEATSLPTSLGTCADGRAGSRCYDDDACVFGRCESQSCTAGLEGSACSFNTHCASGFCRITDPTSQSGSCVNGEQGSGCTDEGDCEEALHCTGGACFSDAVGQRCESDDQCASGICYGSVCRGGELGSLCEENADCESGRCASSYCTSGTLFAPCYEPDDCASGLRCARLVCTDGSKDSPCAEDADCDVRACVNGVCSEGEEGAECDDPDDCVSQRCADPAGVEGGRCTSGATGAYCVYDANCVSNSCASGGVCE